jgi:hypothetical protein
MNRTLHTLIVIAAVCLISACASVASVRGGGATRIFTGTVTRADWQTYREVPFDVPSGTERITIAVSHDGREQRTALDLGLVGPNGFRGWSGSNKSGFTLAATDATPSFSPGRIEPGRWILLLGVPAIREGVTTRYEARITLERAPSAPAEFAAAPIREAAGWYRGDFHSHTAHSDGSCAAVSGKRVPCPAFLTLEAARAAGLDFIAVTDHNTAAQNNALRELQGYFDTLLIIPGEEVTTFYGHANAFGIAGPVEFRLGTRNLPTLEALRDQVAARGGLLSINHPGQPTGESCMGCGWNPPDAHPERIEAVEVVNGSALVGSGAEGPSSGIGFWQGLLDKGIHATAIGGSDNHDAKLGTRQSPVGTPATVVYARNLSVAGILEGVRSGRVFIDLGGSASRRAVDLTATAPGQSVSMGGTLRLSPGETGTLHIEAQNLSDLRLELVSGAGGPPLALSRPEIASGAETRTLLLPAAGRGYWVRLNIRDREGKLQVLTNPVYVEPRG